ncbi:hypothetical protein [Methanoculleus sp.]|uniref:DUF7288 family protein n=1 Tax=Methanoculleus sp. TaxID=90427 RepID=UPI0025E3BF0E|nr:hypothetical protein [Methanoculleus sp.]
MVNEGGQLYTMEGVAAGVIMLLTAYIVVSTTSIYTTGDTHIPDMQLEQLGSDVLAMMDTRDAHGDAKSDLVTCISTTDRSGFRAAFCKYCNMRAGSDDDLKMNAYVYYRDQESNTVKSYALDEEDFTTGRENAVRVTRWVQVSGKPSNLSVGDVDSRTQAVLVEVLLWRA